MTDETALREAAEAANKAMPEQLWFDREEMVKGRFILSTQHMLSYARADLLAAEKAARERAEAMLGNAAEQIAELRAEQVYKDLQTVMAAHNETLAALVEARKARERAEKDARATAVNPEAVSLMLRNERAALAAAQADVARLREAALEAEKAMADCGDLRDTPAHEALLAALKEPT